jgi:DNA polymerase-3 subunit alpha
MNLSEGTEVLIGGMISRVKKVITKNGRSAGMPMAIITLEDLEGQIDGTAFAETYAEILEKYPDVVSNESIVLVRGKIDRKRETPSILINEVMPMKEAMSKLTKTVAIKLDRTKHSATILRDIKPIFGKYKGNLRVYAQVETNEGQKVVLQLPKDLAVKPNAQFVQDMDQILGAGSVMLMGDGMRRLKRLQQQKLFQEQQEETTVTQSDEQLAAAMDEEME